MSKDEIVASTRTRFDDEGNITAISFVYQEEGELPALFELPLPHCICIEINNELSEV